MDMTDTDTDHLQVRRELDMENEEFARLEEDLDLSGMNLTSLDCSGGQLCVEGLTDLHGTRVLGSIDMHNYLSHGGIDADNVTAHQVDATQALTPEAFLLRDAEIGALRAQNSEFGTLDLSRSTMAYADLRGAAVKDLVLEETEARIRLEGAAVRTIDADALEQYDITVDDTTYIHDVPTALEADLGYGGLTEREEETVWKLNPLYAQGFEPVSYVEVREAVMEAPQVTGVLSSLQRKGFVERGEEGYRPTGRGAGVLGVGLLKEGHTSVDVDAYTEWIVEHC